jgi:hypothetical protein
VGVPFKEDSMHERKIIDPGIGLNVTTEEIFVGGVGTDGTLPGLSEVGSGFMGNVQLYKSQSEPVASKAEIPNSLDVPQSNYTDEKLFKRGVSEITISSSNDESNKEGMESRHLVLRLRNGVPTFEEVCTVWYYTRILHCKCNSLNAH